jgi:hypothetical protein
LKSYFHEDNGEACAPIKKVNFYNAQIFYCLLYYLFSLVSLIDKVLRYTPDASYMVPQQFLGEHSECEE